MARVTRSTTHKQMDPILNDIDAATNSFESILHAVPSPHVPGGTAREVLGEITPNTEEAPPPKDPVDVELKGLKAAFRSAIGMKKKKKPRKPKNPEATWSTETLENLDIEVVADAVAMAPMAVEPPHYLQHYAATLNISVDHAAPTRTTRQQIAKQQSGQFEQGFSFQGHSGFHPGAYRDPRSFSTQLISNLTDSQFEISRTLELANHSINLADGLRRELEGTINIPQVKALLKQQPQIEVNNILVERDVKMLSPVDDKTPTAALQTPTKVAAIQKSSNKAIDSEDDSFAQVITSRSPANPVSRVDYVDELDKIEDVMDALDEATSPNVKATSPGKIAFLSGKHDSFHGREHLSRIFSPTDAALAKVQTVKRGDTTTEDTNASSITKTVTTSNVEGYRSLRVKTKDGVPQRNTVRKVKSMHFETSSRTASQGTQDLSGPSSSAAKSARPETAPTAQIARGLSRSSSKATETRRPVANKRPASLLPPKQPAKSTKPPTRPTFELPGEAVSRKLKEQRETRQAQRGSEDVDSQAGSVAPKIKSTKAPTKSTFELPGEAISRRKREAHASRLKKQGEEEKQRREFKAKPSRCSFLTNGGVRETAASRARQSMHGPIGSQSEVDAGKQVDSLNVPKRGSTISGGSTRPPLLTSHKSNGFTSNTRLPAAVLSHRNLTPHTSIVGTAQPATGTTSMTGLSTQRSASIRKTSTNLRGKEIYQRQERVMAEMQREKKVKEEAAKRSRELAAEKGRQASREWAEKQKSKVKKADAAMGPGFGPGGQMGLKA